MIGDRALPNGELVGDVLSAISLNPPPRDSDTDSVARRNSFRDLH